MLTIVCILAKLAKTERGRSDKETCSNHRLQPSIGKNKNSWHFRSLTFNRYWPNVTRFMEMMAMLSVILNPAFACEWPRPKAFCYKLTNTNCNTSFLKEKEKLIIHIFLAALGFELRTLCFLGGTLLLEPAPSPC